MIQRELNNRRKGMILLVVVAFLSLFAVMGVTYIIYADSQLRQTVDEVNGQDARQDSMRMVDLSPSYMLNFFLEKILYDEADAVRNNTGAVTNPTPKGVYSSIRGHSLARGIYGWNDAPGALNDRPFNGNGKSNNPVTIGTSTVPFSNMVNHSFFAPSISDATPVKFDPQRGPRVGPNPSAIVEYWNAPNTVVDNQNFFLGALNIDAMSMTPSFHRASIFGATDITSYSAGMGFNNKWVSPEGKYFTLRPRPVDQLSVADQTAAGNNPTNLFNLTVQRIAEGKLFPYPEANGFDVKNLEGFPTGNDSLWMDVGSPVFTSPDGRKYKILIAPLILDLDGRVNLNVAGNLMKRNSDASAMPPVVPEYNADHAGNQGFGRWEINPKLLSQDNPGANPYGPTNSEFMSILSFKNASDLPASSQNTNQLAAIQFPGRYRDPRFLAPGGANPPQEGFFTARAHSYAQVDFNGSGNDGAWGDSVKPNFGLGGFPAFDPSYGGASPGEVLMSALGNYPYHAKFHNPFQSTKDPATGVYTYVFPPSETAALLRWVGKGDSYAKSNLAKSMPMTLGLAYPGDFSQAAVKARNRISTVSSDLDRPALNPIQPESTSPYVNSYRVGDFGFPEKVAKLANTTVPNMMAPFPPSVYAPIPDTVTTSNQTSPALKLNLNRNLNSFPPLVQNGASDQTNYFDYVANKIQFDKAVNDRVVFAREVYETLRNVTGVIKYEQAQADAGNMAIPMADRNAINGDMLEIRKTNRWLAQLAVNIVDYIDNDDINTAMQWSADSKDWVFGVELPRVVINEVYTMAQNDSGDMFNNNQNATMDTHIHTAIELMNPLPPDGNYGIGPGGHSAVLQFKYSDGTTHPNYRVVLCQPGQMAGRLNDVINNQYFNNTGAHDFNGMNVAMDSNGMAKAILDDWTDPNNMPMPNMVPGTWYLGANVNNNSAMVVTDDTTLRTEADPKITATFKSPKLKLKNINKNQNPNDNNAPDVVLQKLVYPGLPHNDIDAMTNMLTNGALPYNPYITIDVFSKRKMNDLRKYDDLMARNPVPDVTTTSSRGRKSPFLDSSGMDISNFANNRYNGNNTTAQNGGMGGAQHTMGLPNSNTTNPLPWLTHLDRQLINPLELLHVSTVKPHELTQSVNRWMDSFSQPYIPPTMTQPEVPARTTYPHVNNWAWFDENTRIYRFLEVAGVTPLQAGESLNGRVLGKVNVNTMPDEIVFQAVADAAPANNFTSGDVTNAYNNLLSMRPISSFGRARNNDFSGPKTKTGLNQSLLAYRPFETSNPGSGETPNGNILDVQGFAGTGASAPLYARKELLTKVANSLTTRSNTFGVWITTGYFEVDPSTTPPRLGAEIGRSEGANIRHRMFAIVDRTNLVASRLDNVSFSVPTAPLQNIDFGVPGNIKLINPATNNQVAVSDGMVLTFEPNTMNEETVVVRLYNNTQNMADPLNGHLVADFLKTHNPTGAGKISIINRGNPGPWAGYDRAKDKDVVIYAEIIE